MRRAQNRRDKQLFTLALIAAAISLAEKIVVLITRLVDWLARP